MKCSQIFQRQNEHGCCDYCFLPFCCCWDLRDSSRAEENPIRRIQKKQEDADLYWLQGRVGSGWVGSGRAGLRFTPHHARCVAILSTSTRISRQVHKSLFGDIGMQHYICRSSYCRCFWELWVMRSIVSR
jgi:hypothetical protein